MSEKIIPLHSVIFCESTANLLFPDYEIISIEQIRWKMIGHRSADGLYSILFDELCHQLKLKLTLGERVVIDGRGLNFDDRQHLNEIACHRGASIYSITRQTEGFGHLIADPSAIKPVINPPTGRVADYLADQWEGITVIGDIHGNLSGLEHALAWADSRQHFVWFLGDVIDYGRHTLETATLVYETVMQGNAAMILGNHERKIARWFNRDDYLRLSDSNRVTIDAYQRLSPLERDQWAGRFRALLAHSRTTQTIENVTLLHAAAHPSLWEQAPDHYLIEQFALYGESDRSNGHYKRTHQWVDAIPAQQTVIVGHEVAAQFPMVMHGALGGIVIFLDTGSGKNGYLSSADLRFRDNGLHLECFTRHQ